MLTGMKQHLKQKIKSELSTVSNRVRRSQWYNKVEIQHVADIIKKNRSERTDQDYEKVHTYMA